jgi:hypothetical protein
MTPTHNSNRILDPVESVLNAYGMGIHDRCIADGNPHCAFCRESLAITSTRAVPPLVCGGVMDTVAKQELGSRRISNVVCQHGGSTPGHALATIAKYDFVDVIPVAVTDNTGNQRVVLIVHSATEVRRVHDNAEGMGVTYTTGMFPAMHAEYKRTGKWYLWLLCTVPQRVGAFWMLFCHATMFYTRSSFNNEMVCGNPHMAPRGGGVPPCRNLEHRVPSRVPAVWMSQLPNRPLEHSRQHT